MECSNQCIHCQHVFDVNNLKSEKRRKIGKHSDVDIVEAIAFCHKLDEHLLRDHVESKVEDLYICNPCFNTLKAIYVSQKKCIQLIVSLKANTSNDFKNFIIKLEYADKHTCTTATNNLKRSRDCLTPSKSGCTPKGKKMSPATTTPKANRRRLNFSIPSRPPTVQQKSPGPKVKV